MPYFGHNSTLFALFRLERVSWAEVPPISSEPFPRAGIWLANAGPETLAPGRHPRGFHYLTSVVLPPVRRPFALGNPFVAGTIYLAGVMKTPVRRPILASYLSDADANHRAIQYFCGGPLGPGCIVTT